MQRLQRSFELTMQSYRILMQDKELLILPVLSGFCILVVCATFLIPMGFLDPATFENADETTFIVPTLIFYVLTYTIGFFFQAALIAGASERMAGGNPTLSSALGAAAKRIGPIMIWGLIAGTVGMIIRAVQDRSEIVGKIIMGIIGVAWSFATFFMVPVLVMEDLPIGASFKRSWAIFKKTWGETVVANFGLGLVGMMLGIPIALVCFLLVSANLAVLAVAVGVLGFVVLSTFMSALQSVWIAAAYRYATDGTAGGFDAGTIQSAFRAK